VGNFQFVHGRLGKDAETFGDPEKPMVKFSVATSEYIGKGPDGKAQYSDTEWSDVLCFGFVAKKAAGLQLQKGDSVVAWGTRQARKRTGNDGKEYSNSAIKADMVVLEYVPEKSQY
jgi:single-stranded DNA-binding protein